MRSLVVLLSIGLLYAHAGALPINKQPAVEPPRQPTVLIRGRVVQASDSLPIARANVVLMREGDSTVIKGMATDAAGGFALTHEGSEATLLRITYVGTTTLFVKMNAATTDDTLDLGTMVLSATELDAVEVVATRDGIQYLAGKKIFDVDKSLTARTGNALDVLKQVPSVNVDQDGNITLRGSTGVNIMIDNKPISAYGNAQQVLQSLPAQVLAKVEVITNPGAKYDAQGQSGILNIVLKKQQEPGVNALVSLTSGLLDNYSGSVSGNRRYEAVNIAASFDASSSRQLRYKRAAMNFDGSSLLREGGSYYKNHGYGGRVGVDLTFDTSNTANLSAEFRTNDGINSDPFMNTFRSPADTTYMYMSLISSGPFVTPGFNASYRHTFDTRRHAITADVSVYPSTFDLLNTYTYTDVDVNRVPLGLPPSGTHTRLHGSSLYIQAQTDYVLPLDVEGSFETGLRATLMGIDATFDFDRLDKVSGAYTRDAALSSIGVHQDNVFAAYVNYSNKFGDWGVQAGLRGEYTTDLYRNPLADGGTVSQNFYRDFGGLFPSASLSYALSEASTVQASYSRRINRPSSPMINPFLDKSDSLNWRTGNPQLLPDYTNSTELGYLQYIGNVVLNTEVFYRHTSNMINLRFRETVAPNTLLEKPYNFGSGNAYGLTVNASADVTEWLRVNAEYSYFHQQAEGSFKGQNFNSEGYGWNGRATINAKMPFEINGQLYADYTAPTVIPQGQRYDFTILSLGLTKSFLDKRLDVAFNWTDFLNTARFGGVVNGLGFDAELLNRRDFALVSVSISYKINDYERRRNQGAPGGASPTGGTSTI